jgi:rare lipoprotein A
VRSRARGVVALLTVAVLSVGCAGRRPPTSTREPRPQATAFERGIASWYGRKFHGKKTASGERYDMHDLTAAHPSLPFGTMVRVVRAENGRTVDVRINDRGPFVDGRIIDLSYAAARQIEMLDDGLARVELYLLE